MEIELDGMLKMNENEVSNREKTVRWGMRKESEVIIINWDKSKR